MSQVPLSITFMWNKNPLLALYGRAPIVDNHWPKLRQKYPKVPSITNMSLTVECSLGNEVEPMIKLLNV